MTVRPYARHVASERDPAPAGLSGIHVGRVAAPLREQVLEGLRNAILDFELKPGQRLVERELIEQIGVSRTTIREVLRQLTAEGLVEVIPQRGAVVRALSPEDAQDLYEVRAALEALAVRRFIERAPDQAVAALRKASEEVERVHVDGGDIRQMLRAKDAFYDVLLTGAAGPSIRQVLTGVQARVRLLRATSLSAPGRPARAATELRTLVDAIEARDTERATDLCVEHIRHAAAAGLGTLETKN
jgi:DNA-binding GntR family transcriptional regulator